MGFLELSVLLLVTGTRQTERWTTDKQDAMRNWTSPPGGKATSAVAWCMARFKCDWLIWYTYFPRPL